MHEICYQACTEEHKICLDVDNQQMRIMSNIKKPIRFQLFFTPN